VTLWQQGKADTAVALLGCSVIGGIILLHLLFWGGILYCLWKLISWVVTK
jgi:hypothetical protein